MGNILVSLVSSKLDMCSIHGENELYAHFIAWCTLSKPWSYRPCFDPLPIITSETENRV